MPLALLLALALLAPSTVTREEAWARQQARVKDTAKKRKLNRKGVEAHNRKLIAALTEDLPPRDFAWRYITVHHTASEWSSLQRIDRYHRDKFEDPSGIEYHFLIANGKRQPRGLIELGRWPLQERSIHLFKPEGAPDSITISLVGNLEERAIYPQQYAALIDLMAELMRRYEIPLSRLTTHKRVDGNLTACPGKHFPFERMLKDLRGRLKRTHPALVDLPEEEKERRGR